MLRFRWRAVARADVTRGPGPGGRDRGQRALHPRVLLAAGGYRQLRETADLQRPGGGGPAAAGQPGVVGSPAGVRWVFRGSALCLLLPAADQAREGAEA